MTIAVGILDQVVKTEPVDTDRLYLTGALRTDQNSAFGTNFQHVVYPKLSASYIVSDESWFPKMNWLSSMRLRE